MTKPASPGHDCPICGSTVIGRSDKVYCSVRCKNQHHAATRKMNKPITRETDRKLKRNYTLLQGFMGNKHATLKVSLTELTRRGFDPFHFTGGYLDSEQNLVMQCYRFRYVISEGVVYIYQNLEEAEELPGVFGRWRIDPVLLKKIREDEEPDWAKVIKPQQNHPKRE